MVNAASHNGGSPKLADRLAPWLGPCASVLCLIHCVGFALLALLAPSFASALPHTEWIDFTVLGTVVLSGGYALRNFRAGRPSWVLFTIFTLLSVGLHLAERHKLGHLAVVALSLIQIPHVLRHFGSRKQPPCCGHDHA